MRPVDGSMATMAPRWSPSRRVASSWNRTSTERCTSLGSVGWLRNLRSSSPPGLQRVEADQLPVVGPLQPGGPEQDALVAGDRRHRRDGDIADGGRRPAAGRCLPRPRPGRPRSAPRGAARSAASWSGLRGSSVSGPAWTTWSHAGPTAMRTYTRQMTMPTRSSPLPIPGAGIRRPPIGRCGSRRPGRPGPHAGR